MTSALNAPGEVRMRPGSWLVLAIVVGALVLALVALRFRAPMPVRTTQPVTQPSTTTSAPSSPSAAL
jgi:hypothetical protein